MKKRIIGKAEPYSMSPELEAEIEEMTQQADADIAEMRVNMRWGSAQIALVKRAAALFGMPYQTYVKQAAFRQAVADLHAVEALVDLADEKVQRQVTRRRSTPKTLSPPRKRASRR